MKCHNETKNFLIVASTFIRTCLRRTISPGRLVIFPPKITLSDETRLSSVLHCDPEWIPSYLTCKVTTTGTRHVLRLIIGGSLVSLHIFWILEDIQLYFTCFEMSGWLMSDIIWITCQIIGKWNGECGFLCRCSLNNFFF